MPWIACHSFRRAAAGVFAGLLIAPGILMGAQLEENYPFAKIAMPELMLGAGTRAAAMGGAGVALADGLASMYWNPAGLAGLTGTIAEFAHLSWIEEVNQESLALGLPLLGGYGAIGFDYMGLGEIERTFLGADGRPEQSGELLHLSMFTANLAYARRWKALHLDVGARLKMAMASLVDATPTTMAVDLGGVMPVTAKGMLAGVAVQNLGFPVDGFSLPTLLRAGAAFPVRVARDHAVTAAVEMELPVAALGQSSYRVGVEYGYAKTIFGRLGYLLSELGNHGAGLTAGLGAMFSGWRVGYTFAPQGDLGTGHYLTLAMDFGALARQLADRPAAGADPQALAADAPSYLQRMEANRGTRAKRNLSPGGLGAQEEAMRSLIERNFSVKVEMRRREDDGIQEMLFKVMRRTGPRIASWALVLTEEKEHTIRELTGNGMPTLVAWDLHDAAGRVVESTEKLRYSLTLTDVNGKKESVKGRLLKPVARNRTPQAKTAPFMEKKFEGIIFEPGRAEITPAAANVLSAAAEHMHRVPGAKVLIEGFCDPIDEANQALLLSKSRAEAVARYLTAYMKISMTRILIRPRGVEDPVATSGEPRLRYQNRRVEITIKGLK